MASTTEHYTGRVTVTRVVKDTTTTTRGYANEDTKTERRTVEELDVAVRADTTEGVTAKLTAAIQLLDTDAEKTSAAS